MKKLFFILLFLSFISCISIHNKSNFNATKLSLSPGMYVKAKSGSFIYNKKKYFNLSSYYHFLSTNVNINENGYIIYNLMIPFKRDFFCSSLSLKAYAKKEKSDITIFINDKKIFHKNFKKNIPISLKIPANLIHKDMVIKLYTDKGFILKDNIVISIKYKGEPIYQTNIKNIVKNIDKFKSKYVLLNAKPDGWSCPSTLQTKIPENLSRSAFSFYDDTGCIYGTAFIICGKILSPELHTINIPGKENLIIYGKILTDKNNTPYIIYKQEDENHE